MERVTYDNMSTAVAKVLSGKQRKLTKKFKELMGYYAFEANFCTPGLEGAHEKGGIEGSIGFSRRNWMVPVPKFDSIDALNAYILGKCEEDEQRTVDGENESIGESWEREKPLLLEAPTRPFDPGVRKGVLVDRYQTVELGTNRYSVPSIYVGKPLWIRAYWNHLEIGTGLEVVARYSRSYGRDQYILRPEHYLDVLEKKPNAVPYARPLVQHEWPAGYWEFYEQMVDQYGPSQGGRDFVRVLRGYIKYGVGLTTAAIRESRDLGTPNADVVLAIVDRERMTHPEPEQLDMSNHQLLCQYKVELAEISRYQVLIERGLIDEQCVA